MLEISGKHRRCLASQRGGCEPGQKREQMAYITLQSASQGGVTIALEGRPLRAGDPLWVPKGSRSSGLVEAWLAAVFLEADLRSGTLSVVLEDGQDLTLPIRLGLRRRYMRTRIAERGIPGRGG